MDFFGAQDRARRSTGRLVALFVVAVISIILAVYAAAALVLRGDAPGFWDPSLFVMVAGGVSLVVLGASAVRSASLRSGGGRSVAEMLGGRLVSPDSGDVDDRRILNVVEEVALAAGTPVPSVYVLENESAINAFAAGYSPEDAVVAVTRGTLNALSRDELQAVVAHEFSHIVNRDIRLNIQLTGILFGILALGLGGRILLRSAAYSRGGRRDGRALAAALAIGLALFIAGYLGVWFGRMIRAGVSRQREYLADAAAVQFTRNPEAMASTLKKIGAAGSRLDAASAEEVSHFFFANGLRSGLVSNLWATHPPLAERIRRIDPHFDGDFSKIDLSRPAVETETSPAGEKGRQRGFQEAVLAAGVLAAGTESAEAGAAAQTVDEEFPAGAEPEPHAIELPEPMDLGAVPQELHAAAHEPFGAVALAYALVVDRDESSRKPQMAVLRESVVMPLYQEVLRLQPFVDDLPESARLPLLDLAAPSLASLSQPQAEKLSQVLGAVARADHRLSIFEFALETAVRHRLAATHGSAKRPRGSSSAIKESALLALGALAHAGTNHPEAARAAFSAGIEALGYEAKLTPPACTSEDVRRALEHLADAREDDRQRVFDACSRTVLHDRQVTPDERLLLRAIAAALDLPAPAYLPRFAPAA